MADPLEILARSVQEDAFFLGCILTAYCRLEHLDDTSLARRLGCSLEDLVMLRLCRSPREDGAGFRDDLFIIAGRFNLDLSTFTQIVKRGRVTLKFSSSEPSGKSLFMAARDREEDAASENPA